MKKRVFSGIQPSGQITLGNYLGAMRQFVGLQQETDAYYCVVDLHAITLPQEPDALRERILDLAALYLAIGLDPDQSTLFVQSDVPAHAQLGWILQCMTSTGELSRMTQFKEKGEGKDSVSAGLFSYPALMAADILLFHTNQVPVGDDQKQHVELARDIAIRFNNRFGQVFTVPEIMLLPQGARIMSLDDPTKKMSKSNPNPGSRIELLDPPDVIRKKVARAVTDSGSDIRYAPQEKAAVSNLLVIYSLITGEPIPAIVDRAAGQGYGAFKRDLAEAVVAHLEPLQERYRAARESDSLKRVLAVGAQKANTVAQSTVDLVRKRTGLGSGA